MGDLAHDPKIMDAVELSLVDKEQCLLNSLRAAEAKLRESDPALAAPLTELLARAKHAALGVIRRASGGGRLLTEEEWALAEPPFCFIRLKTFDAWGATEFAIAVKYAVSHATGWVYYSDKRFVFERSEDFAVFRLWAENKPMEADDSGIEIT